MNEPSNAGLARLQSQSRIAASKWREWCMVLDMSPEEAVEIWEEVCHPIMLSTRQVPPVPQILQLRVDRRQMSIFDFKDEVAKPLAFFGFLAQLKDENLIKGNWKASILALYRKQLAGAEEYRRASEEVDRFVLDLCTAVVIAKVLKKGNINLHSVLSVLIKGNASLSNLAQLARQSLGDVRYGDAVERFLNDVQVAPEVESDPASESNDVADDLDAAGVPDAAGIPDGDAGAEVAPAGEGAGHAGEHIEAEIEVGDFDLGAGDEDEEEEEEEQDLDVMGKFRSALRAIYNVETAKDRSIEKSHRVAIIRERQEVITRFDPLRVVVPSMEEAQAIVEFSQTTQGGKRIHKPVMKAPRPGTGAGASSTASTSSGTAASPGATPSSGSGGGSPAGRSPASGGGSAGGDSEPSKTITIGTSAGGSDDSKARAGSKKKRVAQPAAASVDSDAATGELEPTDAPAAAASSNGSGGAASGNVVLTAQGSDGAGVVSGEEVDGIEVAEEDLVQLVRVRPADFSQAVRLTGQLLAAVEQEQVVWENYLEPETGLEEIAELAEQVASKGTDANKAYGAIKALAQRLQLKEQLAVPDALGVQKERRFAIEVPAYVNSVTNNKMAMTPSDRQLAPLGRILDTAAATLMRLENLRVNQLLSEHHPDEYTAENVAAYRETALEAVLVAADPDLLEQARERAEVDTEEMLAAFRAERFAEQLLEEARGYVAALAEEGHTNSLNQLNAALGENPMQFQLTVAEDHEPPPPENLQAQLEPSALGEIFDAVCEHVCTRAWALLDPDREPEKAIGQIKNAVREMIPGNFILQPEKKRHSERPRIALSVISLDKVSGNTLLKDLYVRIGVGGRIFFVEGFKDGTYVDLFELREYTPVRIQSNAAGEGGEPLKTGEKYLYTVGRTNKIFAATAEEVRETCIREEDGSIKVFQVFRASTRG